MPRGGRRSLDDPVGVPNLYRDPRTGIIYYRRQKSGAQERLSTGETSVEAAVAWKKRHEEGEETGDSWQQPLLPLAERWIADLDCCPDRRSLLDRQIRHALEALELEVTGDLRDRAAIKTRVRALEPRNKTQFSKFQAPLKQFSAWLAEDHIPRDPLAAWRRIDTSKEEKRPRRACEPVEVALALAVSAWLDEVRSRKPPTRAIFLALLTTAPRVGALEELTVADFDRTEKRLVLGDDVANKQRGRAELDDATFEDISAYVGDRKKGALFLSQEGEAIAQKKLLAAWRECMDIGLVVDLWPAERVKKLQLAWEVARYLGRGKVPNKGGNPRHLDEKTLGKRREHEAEVAAIGEQLREPFMRRRRGVDVHGFRTTHQSWADARGVLPAATDAQLGHANKSAEVVETFLASRVGRTHYLDRSLSLFRPRDSAAAVRATLDEAEAALHKDGYRGWDELLARAPKPRPVSKTVSTGVAAAGTPEREGPEPSQAPALSTLEVTGLEPVASTLRT
jgi:hypothetical protein